MTETKPNIPQDCEWKCIKEGVVSHVVSKGTNRAHCGFIPWSHNAWLTVHEEIDARRPCKPCTKEFGV